MGLILLGYLLTHEVLSLKHKTNKQTTTKQTDGKVDEMAYMVKRIDHRNSQHINKLTDAAAGRLTARQPNG